MSTVATTSASSTTTSSRSTGTKFFVILLLASVMSVSGFFIDSLTAERAGNYGLLATSSSSSVNASEKPRTVLGIRLADSYRSMHRSLHYIPLFLGFVFLTYFLFEVLTRKSVHPAQYSLVGVAQVIFYLLLLSLAEHLGFDWSFLLAGGSTVALFACNTEWVFQSRKLAVRAAWVFATLYLFIYVLLRVEAYALLVGATASFAAVAAAMYITRNVDWYGNGERLAKLAGGAPATLSSRESWLD